MYRTEREGERENNYILQLFSEDKRFATIIFREQLYVKIIEASREMQVCTRSLRLTSRQRKARERVAHIENGKEQRAVQLSKGER